MLESWLPDISRDADVKLKSGAKIAFFSETAKYFCPYLTKNA